MFVYIVQNSLGKICGVFQNYNRATEIIPEGKRVLTKQVHVDLWEYGEFDKWKITCHKVTQQGAL